MPRSAKHRLRFWIEWGGSACLWADNEAAREAFGEGVSSIDLHRLPLSAVIISRIEQHCAWYQTALNWDYPPDPGPWRREEGDRFNAATLDLLPALTIDLGADFEVINARLPIAEDPDLEAYLQDPKRFRRR